MKTFKNFLVISFLTFTFFSCSQLIDDGASSATIEIADVSRTITYESLSSYAYMGGSLLYSQEANACSQLLEGVCLAVRLDSGLGEQALLGYLKVLSVNFEKINLCWNIISADGDVLSRDIFLETGSGADLDGNGSVDVFYGKASNKKAGLEDAMWLSFISSEDEGTTAMFSLVKGQFGGDYPSGLVGINSDGKYVVLFEGFQSARSATGQGFYGDFVIDCESGDMYEGGSGRSLSSVVAAFEKVFPILYLSIGDEADSISAGTFLSESYADYTEKKEEADSYFSSFKKVALIDDFDEDCSVAKVGVKASVGVKGALSVKWGNVESTLSAAIFVEAEVSSFASDKAEGCLFERDFSSSTWNFMVGPVPLSVGLSGKVSLPYELSQTVSESAAVSGLVASYTGLYSGSVKVGRSFDGDSLCMTACYFGYEQGGNVLCGEDDLSLALSIMPCIALEPKVGFANNLVWLALPLKNTLKLTGKFSLDAAPACSCSLYAGITYAMGLSLEAGLTGYSYALLSAAPELKVFERTVNLPAISILRK